MARILIADDSAVIRGFYENLLDYLGHEIISCKDGKEALEKFAVERVDLMILDVQMPEKSGIEVCREVRQHPRGLNIPIIIASSEDKEDVILDGLNAGANDYLLKPLKESHLIARLKNLLKSSTLYKSDYELVKNQVIFAERYKIRKIIGYGRHSIVFMVEDIEENNEKKVLKLLNDNISDPNLLSQYLETAQQISEINSEHITKTFCSGQSCGRCYLIMEYNSGGDLRKLFTYRKLSWLEAVHLGSDISSAIRDLEEHGIVHFDIKPENILISEDGHFKLADFGMLTTRDTVTIPMNAEIWSTAAYVSPEYINAEHDVGPRSDIYSLGVTIHEGLTGDNPFVSDKPMNSLYRQLNFQVPDLISLYKNIPRELSDIVRVMLVKNPVLRPTASDCVDVFSALLALRKSTLFLQKTLEAEVSELKETRPEDRDLSDKNPEQMDSEKKEQAIKNLINIKKKAEAAIIIEPLPIREKTNLLKVVVLMVVCLILFAYAGMFISSFFSTDNASVNSVALGPLTVISCPKCGKMLEKRCKDVSKEKCPECSTTMAMALKCVKCSKEFADKEEYYDTKTDSVICPFCKSDDIEYVPLKK